MEAIREFVSAFASMAGHVESAGVSVGPAGAMATIRASTDESVLWLAGQFGVEADRTFNGGKSWLGVYVHVGEVLVWISGPSRLEASAQIEAA